MHIRELLSELGELKMVMVPRPKEPLVKIVELLESSKVEDSPKQNPPTYSSLEIVFVAYKPLIA